MVKNKKACNASMVKVEPAVVLIHNLRNFESK